MPIKKAVEVVDEEDSKTDCDRKIRYVVCSRDDPQNYEYDIVRCVCESVIGSSAPS